MAADRRRPTSSAYHLMSAHEKQVYARQQVREAAIACPGGCGMQLMHDDLLSHLRKRCTGKPEPGPTAKWIGWREAESLGVPRETLYRWARQRRVRVIIRDGTRRFLKGDLINRIAEREPVVLGFPGNGNETP